MVQAGIRAWRAFDAVQRFESSVTPCARAVRCRVGPMVIGDLFHLSSLWKLFNLAHGCGYPVMPVDIARVNEPWRRGV